MCISAGVSAENESSARHSISRFFFMQRCHHQGACRISLVYFSGNLSLSNPVMQQCPLINSVQEHV